MDFFEAQARAKKRTSRLVLLFVLAVAGTIAAAYFAAVFGLGAVDQQQHRANIDRFAASNGSFSLWQPNIFVWVAAGTLAVVGFASLFKWRQFSSGGSAVAESVGGRRVNPHTTDLQERRLLNVVEEMAIASGTPVPVVFVLDDEPGINAFAAGLTTNDAVVAVTRGTLEKLTRDELQGVVGHEFSHILNGDMRLNLRLTALLFGILVLGLAGRGILWSLRGAHVRSRNSKNSGGVLAAIVAVGLALLIIGYVGYFFGRIIQAAVSRQREFLADASAVQFTRNPLGLSGALKKIGGYALGSSLQTSKAAAIGHFFFAQSFRSGLTGLWATHPPLNERIRAIEPTFDGRMFEPPEVVDVANESFAAAGLAPRVSEPARQRSAQFDAASAVAAAGSLTSEQIANAASLLADLPPSLREAAHSAEAPTVIYGLLLDTDPALRQKQRASIAAHAGQPSLDAVDRLASEFTKLRAEHKLPLLQLALPALRTLSSHQLAPFLETLDELVHSDSRISSFEFALQKLLTHSLDFSKSPKRSVVQYHSFNALDAEIGTVLSALAQASTYDVAEAQTSFAAGARQLKLIEPQLKFGSAPVDFAALDAALEKLASASGPIKQRTLVAGAHTISANGSISVPEFELLRAIAAALDVPLPPLSLQALTDSRQDQSL
ncbi:MAG TPA: M48 family metallopeptidase [Opitutus sp.]|nr:M48 family metallopeptidase [Opitutus sp.]